MVKTTLDSNKNKKLVEFNELKEYVEEVIEDVEKLSEANKLPTKDDSE